MIDNSEMLLDTKFLSDFILQNCWLKSKIRVCIILEDEQNEKILRWHDKMIKSIHVGIINCTLVSLQTRSM
jgi:hypothetical protein